MIAQFYVLAGLFGLAFLSSTFIPSQSEAVLFVLLAGKKYAAWMLLSAAIAGSISGVILNYFLGRYLYRFHTKKWFPVKEKSLKKVEKFFNHHGIWALLLAGVPFIGDPITLLGGVMRVNFWIYLLFTGFSKTLRYLFVYALYLGIF